MAKTPLPYFPPQLIVSVTEEDIRLGKPHIAAQCPIALAIKRLYPQFQYVAVAGYIAYTGPTFHSRTYLMPGQAMWFISLYDAGEPVDPTTFTLQLIHRDDE